MRRHSAIVLLSNYACNVGQRGENRLYCDCDGIVVTAFLAVGALVAMVAVAGFALMVGLGADASWGMLFSLMALGLCGSSLTLAIRRYGRHGRFVLDGEEGIVRRYRAGRMVDEFGFDDVKRVTIVLDPTDGIRLHTVPSWLQLVLKTGEVFRLAKGTREELEPVCQAIRRLGLAPA